MEQNQQEAQKSQLEEKLAILEQRLNEMAKNASNKADAKADTLVAAWAKKIIDSRFTYLIVGGAGVYAAMSFYICL